MVEAAIPSGSAPASLQYLGLAPFLRASIAGEDLRPTAQRMLEELSQHGQNANLLMNLSLALQCLQQQSLGLALQSEALVLQRSYTVAASVQPARLRLLVLVTPGSIQSNTPLDCLLEATDIELVFHFVGERAAELDAVPPHDVLFVGISDSDENRTLLNTLEDGLAHWPHPVLNAPHFLPHTGRDRASGLLQGIEGLLAPVTQRVTRTELQALARGEAGALAGLPGGFPAILRPVGSQAGANLQKIDGPQAVQTYLEGLPGEEAFFMAPFVDYSDARGMFRKIRVALIDSVPFVCHMAVSSHWMIHYVNAGMYDQAWKRAEEAEFMAGFPTFVSRHGAALQAIAQRMQLDYLVMDCAETSAGDLLLFEIDHGGVVHAMDVESLFPYKNAHIEKARQAFCALLYGRLARARQA